MEPQFKDLLKINTPPQEVYSLVQSVLEDVWQNKHNEYSKTSEAINTKINEKTLKIQAYLERIPKSQDSQIIELYEKEIGKLKKEIGELQERLIPNPYTSDRFGTALTKVIDTIKDPVTVWENEDLETKFAIFHMYFDTKIPYQRGKGFGTANLAYPIKLMHDISTSNNSLVEMGSIELPSEESF